MCRGQRKTLVSPSITLHLHSIDWGSGLNTKETSFSHLSLFFNDKGWGDGLVGKRQEDLSLNPIIYVLSETLSKEGKCRMMEEDTTQTANYLPFLLPRLPP